MNEYEVILEGTENGFGYFISVRVVSKSEDLARKLSLKKAEESGLKIIDIEEVEELGKTHSKEGVIGISGKSYFDKS